MNLLLFISDRIVYNGVLQLPTAPADRLQLTALCFNTASSCSGPAYSSAFINVEVIIDVKGIDTALR